MRRRLSSSRPSSSRQWHPVQYVLMVALALLLATLSACTITSASGTSGGSISGTPSGTMTPGTTSGGTATSSPTHTPPHVLAWWQYDSHNVPQIWASLNGATATQITHVPSDGSECDDQVAWSLPVFSPDLTHIVAALGSYNCGDGPLTGPLSVITASSGAVTAVPATSGNTTTRLTLRTAGWIDNHTLWYINYGGLYTYALGASVPTLIAALAHPEDAVLRGTTLFWENYSGGTSGNAVLHRYSLASHSSLAGTVTLASVPSCGCSPGDYGLPGWDASPDGSHIVYQTAAFSGSSPGSTLSSSRFFYANADGGGASRIASVATAHAFVGMQIAHNGRLVAITNALPSPSVISASVTSPGNSGDPNLHFYTPDASSFPVWKWDDSTFWAETQVTGDASHPGIIEHFDLGAASGSAGVTGGYNPWYTVGS